MATLTECSTMTALLDGPRPAEWEPVRQAAEKALEGQAFPTMKQEDWKYTDLKALHEETFAPGQPRDVDIKDRILPEARRANCDCLEMSHFKTITVWGRLVRDNPGRCPSVNSLWEASPPAVPRDRVKPHPRAQFGDLVKNPRA